MNHKQAMRLAKELYRNEKLRVDPSATKEEKSHAEEQIMSITNKILAQKDGMETLLEIDSIISNLEKESKENK